MNGMGAVHPGISEGEMTQGTVDDSRAFRIAPCSEQENSQLESPFGLIGERVMSRCAGRPAVGGGNGALIRVSHGRDMFQREGTGPVQGRLEGAVPITIRRALEPDQ